MSCVFDEIIASSDKMECQKSSTSGRLFRTTKRRETNLECPCSGAVLYPNLAPGKNHLAALSPHQRDQENMQSESPQGFADSEESKGGGKGIYLWAYAMKR